MREIVGLVADIQRASVHDGPGFRTTVFFKGCPLHCTWCHNPECISFEKQVMFYPDKCIGCGRCDEGCYSGARVVCGEEMTATEIMEKILLDKDYYGAEGGVTFSGGEPLAQREMLKLLIGLCRKEGINTAIETSLFLFDEEILGGVNLVMADLKIWDDELHLKHTGVSNKPILENFKRLDKLSVPFIVRTPVIPGINDNAECIESIRNFVRDFKNIQKYELLPYHPLGVGKQTALGLETVQFDIHDDSCLEELRRYAKL